MHEAFKDIAAALRKVGYEDVDVLPARKRDHVNVMLRPVSRLVRKPHPGKPDREITIPELIMDKKTKNFAALSVLKDAGLVFDDVQVFNNDLIVRNVSIPAAPKKEAPDSKA